MAKSLEEWENNAFSKIFEFNLNETEPGYFLAELRAELESEGVSQPKLITREVLDRAIISYLEKAQLNIGEYLYKCFKKGQEIYNNLQIKGSRNLAKEVLGSRLSSLEYSNTLATSYFGLSIIFQDMFAQESPSINWFVDILLKFPLAEDPNTISEAFLDSLIVRFKDDGLEDFIREVFQHLNITLYNTPVSGNYYPYIKVIHRLISKPEFAKALTNAEGFIPEGDISPNELEHRLLLGPLLRISTYPDNSNPVHKDYFFNQGGSVVTDVQSTFYTLRSTNTQLVNSLFDIMDKLVRNSGETREKVIELISVILKSNIKRSGMQVDMNTVSSDRFLNNINQLLLKFSQPFLDPQHSKIQRIDMNYYLRTSRADIEDEARIGATKDEFKVYLQDRDLSGVNFISDVFHLNVLCFHLGLLKCISYYQNVYEKLEHMEEELEKLESGRGGLNNPAMGNFNEMILKRFRAKVEETKALKFALEAYLLDHDLLRNVYSFYQLLIAFLLRCLDPTHAYPFNQFQLPIYQPGGKPMDMFRMLPEYYIYDILEFLVFIAKFCPDVLLGQSTQEIVIFITTLLYHQDAINNPYLKIKMVEILYYFTFPLRERGAPEGILGPAMNSNPIALNHLLKSLLKFYVQVEQTGLSSQFHDKFNVRYNISQLLKLLWKHPNHQQQLRSLSQDMNFFVRFVNLLMNDTTYLLDESISKLTEIHDIQTEMEDTITWNNQTQEYRAEREKLLATDERMAKSYVGLSNKNVNLLNYVTEFIPTPFLSPEIVTRLAAMLNYTLTSLVGPKCSQLKVKNAKEYGFQPRALLSQLLMIFVHLKSKDFVSALAEDGRSYSNELYQRAINVVTKHGLLEHSQIQEFKNIMVQVEKEAKSNIEQAIDDIPEEYLDPLMFTMMKEPVLLPSSGMIVDLATIKAHLLSDSTDPFNRQALSIEQVVPQPELKEKIAQFIISKK